MADRRIDDGHEHRWTTRAGRGLCCMRCDVASRDLAEMIEPARVIDVDPTDLLGWEDNQNGERVRDLADAMRRGETVPAIMVGTDGLSLYDGHHRVAAARLAGVTLKAVTVPMSWNAHGIGSRLQVLRHFAQLTTHGSVEIG